MNFTKAQPISARRTYGGWTGAMRTSQYPMYANFGERRRSEVRLSPGPRDEDFSGSCDVASRNPLIHEDATNVSRPRKAAPEGVLMAWARECSKEDAKVDWQKLLPPQGFVVLPRRWVVERTFSWIDQNRRMSKDYERLATTSEAFIYVAMSRLMVRRLARAQ